MSKKPSKPETRIEDYLDVMTGGNAVLPQPILRIEFYYAFLAGMTVELPQPILDDEKLLAKICGMEVEAPTYIPGLFPRLYAYMAKKGGQDVQVPDPILRLERYWYDYSAGEAPSVQEYTGAVPVTFIADGTPLLDLLISGNEEHSGTPTPDNPIMPEGTGDRTGNLYGGTDISGTINNTYYKNDFVYANLSQGTYTLAFDLETTATSEYRSSIGVGTTTYSKDIQVQTGKTDGHFVFTFTISEEDAGKNLYARFARFGTAVTITYTASNIMLNIGSTALPYEKYGYKIPISSANTTTPVYLGEVETMRYVKKWVLDGTEAGWNSFSGVFYNEEITPDYLRSPGNITVLCTHYSAYSQVSGVDSVPAMCCSLYFRTDNQRLYINDNNYSTIEDFKSYLQQQYTAGTPVTVWYVLATEETAVVNEPLMKIGDYADTLSMEQAGVSIPTANGSTTLDVETTVPPSEVYIKYRGEAVATLSTLSAEVSSPAETPEEKNPEEMEEEENER